MVRFFGGAVMLAQTKSTWRSYPPIPAREDCTICQGTGWELMPSSGFSRARRCPCAALTRAVKLKEQIRIPQRYERCTLESYQPRNLSQTHALAEAWKFVERFPQLERGLIFVGGHGVGKTHLVVGIALELVQRFQEDILFVDFQSLPGLRRSLGRPDEGAQAAMFRPRDVSLLILDNMGAGSNCDGHYESALQIIQARMRAKRLTLCTSFGAVETAPSQNGPGNPRGARRRGLSAELYQMHALLFGGFKILRMTGESYLRNEKSPFSLF